MSERLSIVLVIAALSLSGTLVNAQPVPQYSAVVLEPVTSGAGEIAHTLALRLNDLGQAVGQAQTPITAALRAAVRYTPGVGVEDLDPFGTYQSGATLINNSGDVYGLSRAESGDVTHFVFRDSGFEFMTEEMGSAFRRDLVVRAMNDNGDLLGSTSRGLVQGAKPYRYTRARGWEDLSELDPRLSIPALGVLLNNRGDAVLLAGQHRTQAQAFLLTHAGELIEIDSPVKFVSILEAINESGQFVGTGSTKRGHDRGFLVTPGKGATQMRRKGFRTTEARHVTPDGSVAGLMAKKEPFLNDTLFVRRPGKKPKVVASRAQFESLASAHGFSLAHISVGGVNDRLEFVGAAVSCICSDFVAAPFLYSPTHGLVDLKAVAEAAGVDLTLSEAFDINNAGQITVDGFSDSGRRTTVVLTPVP